MDEKLNKEEIWSRCLSYIRDRIQETAFQTWFDDVRVSSINKEDITLLVPNKFHYEWLESKYRTLIVESIKSIVMHPLIVNYTVPVTSKSSNGREAAKSWLGCAAVWIIASGHSSLINIFTFFRSLISIGLGK